MDLRLYTKSGNTYYVDVSEYTFDYMLALVTECMDRGDVLTIQNNNQVDVFSCKEIEYFEIVKNDEYNGKVSFEDFDIFAKRM